VSQWSRIRSRSGQDRVGGEEAQGYGRAADGQVESWFIFHKTLDLCCCLLVVTVLYTGRENSRGRIQPLLLQHSGPITNQNPAGTFLIYPKWFVLADNLL
jgi:hypothetical protein